MPRLAVLFAALVVFLTGCVRNQPEVIIITATFLPPTADSNAPLPAAPTPFAPGIPATGAAPTAPPLSEIGGGEQTYTVQPGDTLSAIADANGVSLATLLEYNDTLEDPNILTVGQVLRLPAAPSSVSSSFRILPDVRLVRGPDVNPPLDIAAFIEKQPGYIRQATDEIDGETFNAAQIIERVSLEYSIDPRVLLALLEFRGGWLSSANPAEVQRDYPMGESDPEFGYDRKGLYLQAAWAADQINRGYYGWKYRDLTTVELRDGARLRYAPALNAATVAVQYFLSLFNDYPTWAREISTNGFYQTYVAYFGNPFDNALDPVLPPDLQQPPLILPFATGETWYYTGGPHGGWGNGSAWAAIDFAPPDDPPPGTNPCYISDYFTRAVAPGVIARTDEGTVILDLDGDGDERTGWTILYLHIAAQDRIAAGTVVQPGDAIGRPSCEGGFSNGTHVHLARRYNGEWIPADCDNCPPFVLDGWTVVGLPNQLYQGLMMNGLEQRRAEQGRETDENLIAR